MVRVNSGSRDHNRLLTTAQWAAPLKRPTECFERMVR